MLEVGVYFGYQMCFWNLKMVLFIFGYCNKIYIINFEKMLLMFMDVQKYVCQLVVNCGMILFVGMKCQLCDMIVQEV